VLLRLRACRYCVDEACLRPIGTTGDAGTSPTPGRFCACSSNPAASIGGAGLAAPGSSLIPNRVFAEGEDDLRISTVGAGWTVVCRPCSCRIAPKSSFSSTIYSPFQCGCTNSKYAGEESGDGIVVVMFGSLQLF
jgi:hypothetical protein